MYVGKITAQSALIKQRNINRVTSIVAFKLTNKIKGNREGLISYVGIQKQSENKILRKK